MGATDRVTRGSDRGPPRRARTPEKREGWTGREALPGWSPGLAVAGGVPPWT